MTRIPVQGDTPPAGPAAKLCIVVADDHGAYLETVCALLEWMGHECHSATTGAVALDIARRINPDLAIVDVSLPDMCGFALARAIRLSSRRQPYLVAMAGWLHSEHRRWALDAGFDAHIIKPFDIATLERIVEAPPRAARRPAPALAIVR